MAADSDNPQAPQNDGSPAAEPGARLRAARQAEGLSVDDVAHQLRLEIDVIRAVEADNLNSLGAPVFVKGYLRSYARLLDLPEQELVDAWQPAEQDPEEFRSLSMQTEVKTGTSISMFALLLLFALLIMATLIYLLSGDDEPAKPATLESTPATSTSASPARATDFVVEEDLAAEFVVEEQRAEEPQTEEIDMALEVDEAPSAEPVAVVVAAPDPEPAPQTTVVTDTVEVQLTFSDECWVELSDSSRRLLYGLEKAGSVRNFTAKPPLRFFVGNVDAVSIRLAGKDYAIPQAVRTGRNTARFALNADDIQRVQ